MVTANQPFPEGVGTALLLTLGLNSLGCAHLQQPGDQGKQVQLDAATCSPQSSCVAEPSLKTFAALRSLFCRVFSVTRRMLLQDGVSAETEAENLFPIKFM